MKNRRRLILSLSLVISMILAVWGGFHFYQDDLNKRLDAAARNGDFVKVKRLLDRGADPNGSSSNPVDWNSENAQKPPIIYAVSMSNKEAVKHLVDSGLALNDPELSSRTLLIAFHNNSIEMFELLLELGADPNARRSGSYDFNTLHWIIDYSRFDEIPQDQCLKFAQVALNHGANPNDKGMHGFTPLIYAVSWEKEKLTGLFLKTGANHTLKDNEGKDAMDMAVFRANKQLINLLVKHGVPYRIQEAIAMGDLAQVKALLNQNPKLIDELCFNHNSLLGLALWTEHKDLAHYLISQGSSLMHRNDDGSSLLHLASRANYPDIVEFLLDNGLDVNAKNKSGDTALHTTTFSDCDKAAKVLIRRGANINAKSSSDITPILWSASYDSPKVLKLLLQAGADPNAPGAYDGALPLGSACHYSDKGKIPESVKVLLANGANVNKKDASGRTALHWAVSWHGGIPLIEFLLKKGANPMINDSSGKHALDIASEKGDENIRILLEKYRKLDN